MAFGVCAFSLRINVLILAIIDLVCEVIATALSSVQLAKAVEDTKKVKSSDRIPSDEKDAQYLSGVIAVAFISVLVILFFCRIVLAIILVVGAARNNAKLCQIWLHISAALLVLATLVIIFGSIFGSSGGDISSIVSSVFMFFYKVYMLWVVYCFINHLEVNNTGGYYIAPVSEDY